MRRTATSQVTFARPFVLGGFETVQPAGTYTVDTEDEQIEGISFPAWRRVSTVMQLGPHLGAIEYIAVDPKHLQEALIRDCAQPVGTPAKPSSTDTRRVRRKKF
ncbi:MAG TPA: hypothetical protein VGG10_21615 [Rhizomicrobium sp.]|jgi:hypothetical protein